MDTVGKRLFEDENMAGTLVSEPVNLNNMVHVGIHNTWTGGPTGDIYFEVSGEIGSPSTWEVLDSASVAGSGSQFWIDRNAPYMWCRVRYVPSAGTGQLTSSVITKGDL